MEQIKDTIQALLKGWQEKGRLIVAEDIEALIRSTFSAKEARHLRPSSFRDGVLRLRVDSSTWLYYFNLHRQRLMERLHAQYPAITYLRFVIGPVRRTAKKNSCTKGDK